MVAVAVNDVVVVVFVVVVVVDCDNSYFRMMQCKRPTGKTAAAIPELPQRNIDQQRSVHTVMGLPTVQVLCFS